MLKRLVFFFLSVCIVGFFFNMLLLMGVFIIVLSIDGVGWVIVLLVRLIKVCFLVLVGKGFVYYSVVLVGECVCGLGWMVW